VTALEERKRLAGYVFAGLAGVPAVSVRLLASALELSAGPVARVSQLLDSFADTLEFADVDEALATLQLAWAMQVVARDEGCDELLERLVGVQAPPWPQLRAALVAVRDNSKRTMPLNQEEN
jgi:hypothetical protein